MKPFIAPKPSEHRGMETAKFWELMARMFEDWVNANFVTTASGNAKALADKFFSAKDYANPRVALENLVSEAFSIYEARIDSMKDEICRLDTKITDLELVKGMVIHSLETELAKIKKGELK